MPLDRRHFLLSSATVALGAAAPGARAQDTPMYGLIGKMKAVPGQRDALAKILLDGSADMPGCLGYVVAHDHADADSLWITEVWDSEASHAASLGRPGVQAAIAKGRPLIASFGDRIVTTPIGGQGLPGR